MTRQSKEKKILEEWENYCDQSYATFIEGEKDSVATLYAAEAGRQHLLAELKKQVEEMKKDVDVVLVGYTKPFEFKRGVIKALDGVLALLSLNLSKECICEHKNCSCNNLECARLIKNPNCQRHFIP